MSRNEQKLICGFLFHSLETSLQHIQTWKVLSFDVREYWRCVVYLTEALSQP